MERFWSKVKITSLYGCWEWTAYKNPKGYGRFHMPDRLWLVHRLVYTWAYGEIRNKLVIDHLCRNRACVNPIHLEAVTQKVNCERGRLVKSHCLRGHKLTTENRRGRNRRCIICAKEWEINNIEKRNMQQQKRHQLRRQDPEYRKQENVKERARYAAKERNPGAAYHKKQEKV